MDLWIRTQSDGLHQIIGIKVIDIQRDYVELMGYNNYERIKLGVYKTKERALEVLDEIQGLFIKKDIVKTEMKKDGLTMIAMPATCTVYEMPKE